MHNYILLILCFGIKLATAQSIPRFNGIATAINEAFEGSGLRGQQFTYSISVGEGQLTVTPAASDLIGTATLKAVLSTYVDSLVPGQTYTASIYFDEYTAKAYATFYQPAGRRGVFPNYDNYFPEPRGGFKKMMQTIHNDLERHRHKLDTVRRENWHDGVSWLVDVTGAAKSINDGYWERRLDSTKLIGWTPGIYYGHPMNAIVRIRIATGPELGGCSYRSDWIRFSYVLPDQYREKWVRFEKDTPKPAGQTVVSFIFNPLTLQMESPLIHQGNTSEAKELIAWLEKRPWKSRFFYWEDRPYAVRSYFCLD